MLVAARRAPLRPPTRNETGGRDRCKWTRGDRYMSSAATITTTATTTSSAVASIRSRTTTPSGMPTRLPRNIGTTRRARMWPRTSYRRGKSTSVPSTVLVTTAGFTSQARERSGTITSAKPNAVSDWQAAARKAMATAATRISADNR